MKWAETVTVPKRGASTHHTAIPTNGIVDLIDGPEAGNLMMNLYHLTYMLLLMSSLFYDFLVIFLCLLCLPLLLARGVVTTGTPVKFESLLPVWVLTEKFCNRLLRVRNNSINILWVVSIMYLLCTRCTGPMVAGGPVSGEVQYFYWSRKFHR